jgi:hypothetical protein
MQTEKNMEERLWDYIDGLSGAEEKILLEKFIETNAEWQMKYEELMEIHLLMGQSIELDAPSMRFTQNVMEAIAHNQIAPATKSYINKKIIYGIGLFFVTLILGLLVYAIAQANWTSSGTSSAFINKYTPSKINYDKYFNSTNLSVFMMLNMVMGMMLLDMWLNKKRKHFHQQ